MPRPRNAILCRVCLTFVESVRAGDPRACDCGMFTIDGGPEYQLITGPPDETFHRILSDDDWCGTFARLKAAAGARFDIFEHCLHNYYPGGNR